MRDDLSLLQAQLTYKQRLVMVLKELYDQQRPLVARVAKLEKQMRSEEKDLQRLEGRSLAAFFYYVTGRIDEKRDMERREAYAARVKYDAARRELDAIEQDIDATKEDLADLADCEKRYAEALEAKRQALETTGTAVSEALLEKERELSWLQSQETELDEAIAAGTAALHTANAVVVDLKHTEEWGNIVGRKGFLADMAKHETLDDAQKNAEELQVYLQRFNKEVADLDCRSELQGSMDSLLKFSETFLDSLLSGDAAQTQIQVAISQVDQTRDHILGILRQLQTRLEAMRHNQVKVKREVDAMILESEL